MRLLKDPLVVPRHRSPTSKAAVVMLDCGWTSLTPHKALEGFVFPIFEAHKPCWPSEVSPWCQLKDILKVLNILFHKYSSLEIL